MTLAKDAAYIELNRIWLEKVKILRQAEFDLNGAAMRFAQAQQAASDAVTEISFHCRNGGVKDEQ